MVKLKQLLLSLIVLASMATIEADLQRNALRTEWKAWKQLHGRSYVSKKEEKMRFRAFMKNSIFILNHNAEAFNGKHSYYLKMNQFGDMLHSEFLDKVVDPQGKYRRNIGGEKGAQSFSGIMKKFNVSKTPINTGVTALPKEIDWRSKGAVTPVKDATKCHYIFCTAYISMVESMEGNLFMKTKRLIPLSVQQTLDCAGGFGGDWWEALGSLGLICESPLDICGLESAETYPYTGTYGQSCKFDKKRMVAPLLTDNCYLGGNCAFGEAVTAKLLQKGPLATGINTRGRSFQFYSKGVYSDPKCNDGMFEKDDFLNYFALIVGYGITPGQQQFWNVKTSLGTNWGEEGYIRIEKGIAPEMNDKDPRTYGMCGVAGFTGLIETNIPGRKYHLY